LNDYKQLVQAAVTFIASQRRCSPGNLLSEASLRRLWAESTTTTKAAVLS